MNASAAKTNALGVDFASPVAIVLLAFLISYLVFFVQPVASSFETGMHIPGTIPSSKINAVDLRQMLSYSRSLSQQGETPYVGNNLYPPMASILFVPFVYVDFSTAYSAIVIATVLAFGLSSLILPLWAGRKLSPILLLVFWSGLYSYGLLFELERGQFNAIALTLCFVGIWLYHYRPNRRMLAYGLFTLSVQLKIFPVIFVLMYLRKRNYLRTDLLGIAGLLLVNVALCFVLGPKIFGEFVAAVQKQSLSPYVWIGNHSITSFVSLTSTKALNRLGWNNLSWIHGYATLIETVLLVLVLSCIAFVFYQSLKAEAAGPNPYLLIALTLGAMLIPPVSHDYKLSILTGPVAFLLSAVRINMRTHDRCKVALYLLLFVFSFAYASTLFSFSNKPLLFANNFAGLLIMLLAITGMSYFDHTKGFVRTCFIR